MERNTAITIRRIGNGFEIEDDSTEFLVFESKKKLIRFVDSHFSEKRVKKEGKGE